MMYIRTWMRNISINTGILLSPLFTFPMSHYFSETLIYFTDWEQAPQDLSSVMIGYIKIDLVFTQYMKEKEIRFPPNTTWLDLNTMELISGPVAKN
jgi:hypothetical protein